MNESYSELHPPSRPLMRRFATSLAATSGAYVLLGLTRNPYLLSLGFSSSEINSMRSVAIALTLLINTPLSAYADKINRRGILNLGCLLQLLSAGLYLIVAERFSTAPHQWLRIALAYFLLELGKHVTQDTLWSISMVLFAKKDSPECYAQYSYTTQRAILYCASASTVVAILTIKIFSFQACFFMATLLFAFARFILSPARLMSYLPKQAPICETTCEPLREELQSSQRSLRSKIVWWLQTLSPFFQAIKLLFSTPWGLCTFASTFLLGIIREYVVHFWAILFFKTKLAANPNMDWSLALAFIAINLGFTATSLFLIRAFKKLYQRRVEAALQLILVGLLGCALVGFLNPELHWICQLLSGFGLCLCFGTQEVTHLMLHQFFARCADPKILNSTQHLRHIFAQLAAILALRFVHYFPQYENRGIFRLLLLLFALLWVTFWQWKNVAFPSKPSQPPEKAIARLV